MKTQLINDMDYTYLSNIDDYDGLEYSLENLSCRRCKTKTNSDLVNINMVELAIKDEYCMDVCPYRDDDECNKAKEEELCLKNRILNKL